MSQMRRGDTILSVKWFRFEERETAGVINETVKVLYTLSEMLRYLRLNLLWDLGLKSTLRGMMPTVSPSWGGMNSSWKMSQTNRQERSQTVYMNLTNLYVMNTTVMI